ncbi:hypothetical protein BKA65DRAFT_151626 [Rhexocercosporidium sp. MPI-PUGE-AT-0058]|nr:hypothetical protein BKA65DRAFT_151626 [Rhexocercosporidium sp. MPI-PUGE-AT-0058]
MGKWIAALDNCTALTALTHSIAPAQSHTRGNGRHVGDADERRELWTLSPLLLLSSSSRDPLLKIFSSSLLHTQQPTTSLSHIPPSTSPLAPPPHPRQDCCYLILFIILSSPPSLYSTLLYSTQLTPNCMPRRPPSFINNNSTSPSLPLPRLALNDQRYLQTQPRTSPVAVSSTSQPTTPASRVWLCKQLPSTLPS